MDLRIRPILSPDIERLINLDHQILTSSVWQMSQSVDANGIHTSFIEVNLPREMKLTYPRSPDSLELIWKDFSLILVGCVDEVPVGYITLNTSFSPDVIWIKDLVVDGLWRRKRIGTALYLFACEWGKKRNYKRTNLEMSSKNFPGIKLAGKLGFEYCGFNDSYFRNNDIAVFFSRLIG